jgi:hypothetical protein
VAPPVWRPPSALPQRLPKLQKPSSPLEEAVAFPMLLPLHMQLLILLVG